MSERRTPIQSYQLDYLCDSCGTPVAKTGEKFLGRYLGKREDGPGGPTMLRYVCLTCGAEVWLGSEYPRIVHEPVLELS